MVPALRSPGLLGLLEQALCLAQLVLGGALRLVRASFRFFGLVASHGSGGLLGLTLRLVQRPFALVLAAAFSSARVMLPSSIALGAILCLPVRRLPENRALVN